MLKNQTLTSIASEYSRKGSLYYFVALLSGGSYMPFLFVYLADLGLNGEQIGWLASLSPLMTMLIATPVASLADRKRWRVRIAQIGMAASGVTIFFLHLPTTFTSIAALWFLLAVVSSPIMSIADGLIARMAQRHQLNYGGMRLWGSFGYAVSSLIFGGIWQAVGFKAMFYVASLLYIPLIWIAGKLEEGPEVNREERKPVSVLFRDTGFVLILLATFLAGISNSLAMTFSGIYARWLGGGNLLVGMMIAFSAFAELPSMFFSDRIGKRLRNINTALLSYGLMAAAFLGYILLPNANVLPVFAVVKGLGYGLWMTTTVRLIVKRTPDEWAATAQSLMIVGIFGVAPLIAGPLGGWIHDHYNPAAVFWVGVFGLGLAALVMGLASMRGKLKHLGAD